MRTDKHAHWIAAGLSLVLVSLARAGAPPDDSEGLTDKIPQNNEHRYPAELVVNDDAKLQGLGLTATPIDIIEPPSEPAASEPEVAPDGMPERVIWNSTPIRIVLTVGQERMVHFPTDVRLGFRGGAPGGLRSQSVAGTVYWLASQPFDPVRVTVQALPDGQMILLDLTAEPNQDTTINAAPVQILHTAPATATGKPSGAASTVSQTVTPAFDFVQLTRFAAQQLYGPERLASPLLGLNRLPVRPDPVPLLRGARVLAEPLIAWRGGDYYLTVVRLRNTTRDTLTLDPRDLRGQWLTATFQHARLFPAGDEADTSCVYLISPRPFLVSLGRIH